MIQHLRQILLQAGNLYRVLKAHEETDLVENIVRLQLSYFMAADKSYGESIAKHLGIIV